MEFEDYEVSEDYQVQVILLKDRICRKKTAFNRII